MKLALKIVKMTRLVKEPIVKVETTQEKALNFPRNIQRDAFQDRRALVEKFLNSM